MRILDFIIKKLKFLRAFSDSQFAIRHLQPLRHFSLSQQRTLFILALLILGILYVRFYHPPSLSREEVYKEVVIEVKGDVRNPGILFFKTPPTLKEAIERAGGLKDGSLYDKETLSELLEGGTLITVARESSQEQPVVRLQLSSMEAKKLLVFSIPLNLNRVSADDLCLIPGIGESLAREIVAYREKRRGFRSVDEMKHVKGVGEENWKTFKDFLTVKSNRPGRND